MKGLVVPVKSASPRGATAARKRRTYCAANESKKGTAACCTWLKMAHRPLSVGWAFLSARVHVNGPSTVGSTLAANPAIDKTPIQPIVLVLPMSCLIVPVAKRLYAKYRQPLGQLAKTRYRIAPSPAVLDWDVGMRAKSDATKANVHLVYRRSRSVAVAGGLLPLPSVIRVAKNHHIA